MLNDYPKFHIILQGICTFTAFVGALILIVNLFIGSFLLAGSITIFALDWLYLASENDGK